jgi:hypothetical protein
MLLWPPRLIPENDFIKESNDSDRTLIDEAVNCLRHFAYVGLLEDTGLSASLKAWLGRPFTHQRINEMPLNSNEIKQRLDAELTPEALDLLETRSRLDCKLWMAVATHRIPQLSRDILRERTLVRNVARYARLMT